MGGAVSLVLALGTVRAFDGERYLASVELAGYTASLLAEVPVAYHLRADWVVPGARCLVLLGSAHDPSDMVVVALFGGRPADDPRFDPHLGHRHTGAAGDGPRL